MVTIKEIAKECGVSPATVSNILNGKTNVSEATRQRVLDIVKKRGYRPNIIAQGLRRQKTKTIGIIAEDFTQFTVPAIIDGAIKECEEHGYKTVVQNLRLYSRWHGGWFDNEGLVNTVLEPAVRELETIMVDGIIYIAGHSRRTEMPKTDGIPLVLTYAMSIDPSIPYIVINDKEAGYEMTRFLTELGHKKIGVIAGVKENDHTIQRMEGYQKALFDAGLLYDQDLVIYSNWEQDGGYESVGKLIDKGVKAIFCMNDRMAGGALAYCAQKGIRVGEDVSIVGFDNELISKYMIPQLTTTEIPLLKFGTLSVKALMQLIDGEECHMEEFIEPGSGDELTEDGRGLQLKCSFVERNSTTKL